MTFIIKVKNCNQYIKFLTPCTVSYTNNINDATEYKYFDEVKDVICNKLLGGRDFYSIIKII